MKDKKWEKLIGKKGMITLLSQENINTDKTFRFLDYLVELKNLQLELVRLQKWMIKHDKRLIIIFEGRDLAGKGGAIRRLTERINPRFWRIVALHKPTDEEITQWYFQRYIKEFPRGGEIVIFNRSWYNRALHEPINGYCDEKEYNAFMNHVNDFEKMTEESGIHLVKIYLSINKEEQISRVKELKKNPLKQWKLTPIDYEMIDLWDEYTKYKERMLAETSTEIAPWKIISANVKTKARLEILQYILDKIPYDKKFKID